MLKLIIALHAFAFGSKPVVVASRAIAELEILDDSNCTLKVLESYKEPAKDYVTDLRDVRGALAIHSIAKDEPVLRYEYARIGARTGAARIER